jgi:hypothetical protein
VNYYDGKPSARLKKGALPSLAGVMNSLLFLILFKVARVFFNP